MLPIALQYFIKETGQTVDKLQQKFDTDKLNDNEQGILASAHVVEHFLEKSYDGRETISASEAIGLLTFSKYEEYGEKHADEMVRKLDKFMPDHARDDTHLDLDELDHDELDFDDEDWDNYEDL